MRYDEFSSAAFVKKKLLEFLHISLVSVLLAKSPGIRKSIKSDASIQLLRANWSNWNGMKPNNVQYLLWFSTLAEFRSNVAQIQPMRKKNCQRKQSRYFFSINRTHLESFGEFDLLHESNVPLNESSEIKQSIYTIFNCNFRASPNDFPGNGKNRLISLDYLRHRNVNLDLRWRNQMIEKRH